MPGIMKQAKMKAIMDIISQMEDMEFERLMPKSEEMPDMEEVKPEKRYHNCKTSVLKKPRNGNGRGGRRRGRG